MIDLIDFVARFVACEASVACLVVGITDWCGLREEISVGRTVSWRNESGVCECIGGHVQVGRQ